MQAHFHLPAHVNQLIPICDWNRLPLPSSFIGVVGHGFEALLHSCSSSEEIAQGLAAMERSAISDVLLNIDSQDTARRLVQLLADRGSSIRPWLKLPHTSDELARPWLELDQRYPEYGVSLHLNLAACRSHAQLQKELQRLLPCCERAAGSYRPLRLVLERSAAATPEHLQACLAFALNQKLARLTLSDEDSQLTPLGVRNIFAVLRQHAPQLQQHSLRLEFLAGNARGQAMANAIAALEAGANHIHCTLAGCTEQDQPSPLVALLEHFALPITQQTGLDSYRDFLSQQHGLARRPLTQPETAAQPLGVQQERGRYASTGIAKEPMALSADSLRFVFRVSSDDWHVRLCIEAGETELDLGERVHHYVLLLLAREYCQQQRLLIEQKAAKPGEIDPLSLGWLEREEMHRMIGDNEAQFNVKLCRATKQICSALQSAGLDNYRPISTRVGSIRLDCANFIIFKDSKIEAEVTNWLIAESSAN